MYISRKKRFVTISLFGIGVFVLASSILLNFGVLASRSDLKPTLDLHRIVLRSVARGSWTISQLPLGNTEELSAVSRRVLNFSDYIYINCKRGSLQFDFYAAFWASGKMPVQSVASHVPDNCWVLAGWTIDGKSATEADWSYLWGERPECRTFSLKGMERTHVVFWHYVDGERSGFGRRDKIFSYAWNWIFSGSKSLFSHPPEQVLIRVSFREGNEGVLNDPSFRGLMSDLLGSVIHRGKL